MCVEFVCMWVSGGRGAESVSFGGFSEDGRHVRDATLGHMVFYGGVQDFTELGLTRASGRR